MQSTAALEDSRWPRPSLVMPPRELIESAARTDRLAVPPGLRSAVRHLSLPQIAARTASWCEGEDREMEVLRPAAGPDHSHADLRRHG